MVVCVEGLLLLFLVGLLPLCLRDVALNVLLRSVWDKDICQGCPSRYLNNFGGVLVVAKTTRTEPLLRRHNRYGQCVHGPGSLYCMYTYISDWCTFMYQQGGVTFLSYMYV